MIGRPYLLVVLILSGQVLLPQESDLIDMRDLAGRAISFVGEEGVYQGIDEVTAVGDVNGDGVSDIGFVNKTGRIGEDRAGSFYLVTGGSEWEERNLIAPKLGKTARFWPGNVDETGEGRAWVGNVGDLNGDGFAEFVFSLDNYSPAGSNGETPGMLFIVYGEAGFENYAVELSEITDGIIPATVVYNTSSGRRGTGRDGASVVDLNGDGRRDLVTADTSGVVYVLLDPGELGPRVDLQDLGQSVPGFTLQIPGIPHALTDAGDFDGDGFHDLLMIDAPLSGQGSVYLFFGRANLEGVYDLLSLGEAGDGVQHFLPPTHREAPMGLRFGKSKDQVAAAGDVNDDGFDDILVGESYQGWNGLGGAGVANGRVHLVYGGPRLSGPLPIDEVPAERRTVFHGLGGTDLRDEFGFYVGGPGDVNGDGIPDLLTSAYYRDDRVGEAYLVYGRRDFPEDIYLAQGFHGIRIAGANTLGGLGSSLGPAGDFNADGKPDFLVAEGGLFDDVGHSSALVILGTGDAPRPLTAVALEPRSGFVRGGTAVRVRGSGFEDGIQVRFGETGARVLEVTATEIVVELPAATSPGEVAVTLRLGERTVTARERFEYVADRPEIDLESPGRWGLRIDDVPGTVLGLSLEFADIDADGIDDLLIGSDLTTDWVVTVVRGGRALPETMGAFSPGGRKSQIFKRGATSRTFWEVRVRSVGDINADGIVDVGVAAWQDSSYLFFGRRNFEAELDFEAEVKAGRAVRLLHDPGLIGHFAPLGDLTGDGIDDFAVSLAFHSVILIEGRREWPAELDLEDDDESSIFSRLTRIDTRFAVDFAAAGDVNADGYPDLLVSGESFQRSTAYLVYTRPAGELPQESIIDHYIEAGGGVVFEWEPRSASASDLYMHVAGVGDVNGDGIDDFLLGDEQGTVNEAFQGVTYLIHGRRDFPARVTLPYAMGSPIDLEGVVRLGTQAVDQAGRCVGPAGDYNGDGTPDFLIGSQGNANIDFLSPGRMHVVFGSSDLPPAVDLGDLGRLGFRLEGIRRSTWMNVASFSPGDLNDDGALDFAFTERSSPFWLLEDGVTVPPASVHVVFGLPPSVPFIRGDADGDGRLNITDGVFTLSYLFLGGVDPLCEDATDADDRGTVELTDAVYLLNHLFLGGSEPPPPYPAPGDDPTADQLGCRGF